MFGLQQGGNQVDESLQPVHGPEPNERDPSPGRPFYREAISFSTRSSRDLKGSLQSTVRWAWSLSFRWTQSTVKSRPAAWAAAMKSPRSFARVVCGGTALG